MRGFKNPGETGKNMGMTAGRRIGDGGQAGEGRVCFLLSLCIPSFVLGLCSTGGAGRGWLAGGGRRVGGSGGRAGAGTGRACFPARTGREGKMPGGATKRRGVGGGGGNGPPQGGAQRFVSTAEVRQPPPPGRGCDFIGSGTPPAVGFPAGSTGVPHTRWRRAKRGEKKRGPTHSGTRGRAAGGATESDPFGGNRGEDAGGQWGVGQVGGGGGRSKKKREKAGSGKGGTAE